MNIALCDDEEIILDILEKKLYEYFEKKSSSDFQISKYSNGTNLLASYSSFDVIFLDMDMPAMDGIEVGKQLVRTNSDCKIIIATSREDRFKEAFLVQAFRFITKPFQYSEIEEAMDAVFESQIGNISVEMYYERNLYTFKEKDIKYIEAYNGYVELFVGNKKFRKDCSLSSLENVLCDKIFVLINRKALINLAYATTNDFASVKIETDIFTVSRRKRKEFEQKYIEYDLKYRS